MNACDFGSTSPTKTKSSETKTQTQRPNIKPVQELDFSAVKKIYDDLRTIDTNLVKTDDELVPLRDDEAKKALVIKRLDEVKKITVSLQEGHEPLFIALPYLNNVEQVYIDGLAKPELLDAILDHTTLKKLEFSHSSILKSIPSKLDNLVNLESLSFHDSGSGHLVVDDEGVKTLRKLTKLKDLTFGSYALDSVSDFVHLQKLFDANPNIVIEPNPFEEERAAIHNILLKFVSVDQIPVMTSILNRTPEVYKNHISELKTLLASKNSTTTLTYDIFAQVYLYKETVDLFQSAVYIPKVKKIIFNLTEATGQQFKFSEKIKGHGGAKINSNEDIQQGFKRFENLEEFVLRGSLFDPNDPIGKAGFELKNSDGRVIRVTFEN